jgi:hypothetical protein
LPIVAELNERVEVAVPPLTNPRLVWLRDAVMPAGDDSVRETVPEKLFKLVSVIVDMPEVPASMVREAGVADTENSETLTVTVVE